MSVGCSGLPYGYVELHKVSGKESYNVMNQQANGATRVFRGPWTSRKDFIQALLPGVTEADGELFFTDPGFYPDIPNLMAVSAEVEGGLTSSATGVDNQIAYQDAIITVKYEYVIGNNGLPGVPVAGFTNFITVTGDISNELLTWENEEVEDGDPLLKAMSVYIPTFEITLTELFNIAPKFTNYSDQAGTVNITSFTFPRINKTYNPDEILYRGCSFQEKGFLTTTLGPRLVWELQHRFAIRVGVLSIIDGFDNSKPNWNQFYDRTGDVHTALRLNGSPVYSRSNFTSLFNAS